MAAYMVGETSAQWGEDVSAAGGISMLSGTMTS